MAFVGVTYTFENTEKELYDIEAKPGIVYVSNDKWAKFKCPCGCGQDVVLSLMQGVKPCWIINGNSITPSIQMVYGCRTHFHITNGVSTN